MSVAFRQIAVTIDANDLEAVAAFWSNLLDVDSQIVDHFAFLAPPAAGGSPIWIQRVPEPRTTKNRVHLDFVVDDLAAAEARITELGGSVGERQTWDRYEWRICSDPEGTVFDVMQRPTEQ